MMWTWLKKLGSGAAKVGSVALNIETLAEPVLLEILPPGARAALLGLQKVVGAMEAKHAGTEKAGPMKKAEAVDMSEGGLLMAVGIANATARKNDPIKNEDVAAVLVLQAAAIDGVVQEANGVKAQVAYAKALASLFNEDTTKLEEALK